MTKSIFIKTIIIAILFTSFYEVSAKVYYIAPAPVGNDATGNGSSTSPWKSLFKACSHVTTPGDTIFVKAGLYDETATSKLAVGVSLVGEGITSIITSTTLSTEWIPIIDMKSTSLANGNQRISNLKFDGSSLKVAQALWIEKRNNVEIHNCTFIDFKYIGVMWTGDGGNSGDDPYDNVTYPTNYVTGSKFYNNVMTNCSAFSGYGRGAIYIGGHEGMLFYNNTITQFQRPDGQNGYAIKAFANGGFMRGWKVYNNTLYRVDAGYGTWGFCIEGAFYEGCEFYNNTITGSIDINFMHKGTYNYGVYIHNNTIGPETATTLTFEGVVLEFGTEDVIIERNNFRNCAIAIHHTMRYPEPWAKRVRVSYNLFSNLGLQTYHSAIRFGETEYNFDIEDYEIYNNVFHGSILQRPYFGLHIRGFRSATNVKVLNNIFMNFSYSWFESNNGSSFTNLDVENNILYNNANSNATTLNGTPVNYVNKGNIIGNPNFYSATNFHLTSGSPAIGAGKPIAGLLYDLDSINIGNPPSIGCYETIARLSNPLYVGSVIEDSDPKLLIISYNVPLIRVVPNINSFDVTVKSQKMPIKAVTIHDGKVYLTLASPVYFGDIVTLSYHVPVEKPLQSVTNKSASAITKSIVANNVKTRSF